MIDNFMYRRLYYFHIPLLQKSVVPVDIYYQVANNFLQGSYHVSEIDRMNLQLSVQNSLNSLKNCANH